jgi:hypothetical protein
MGERDLDMEAKEKRENIHSRMKGQRVLTSHSHMNCSFNFTLSPSSSFH